MERKEINVDRSDSKSIGNWEIFLKVLGFLFIPGGLVTAVIGCDDMLVFIIGIAVLVSSPTLFFFGSLLGGFRTIVESAENNKALFAQEYKGISKS